MELIELSQMVKFTAALLFVLALMGGLALLVRRFGSNHPLTAPHKKRLKIVEVLPLSPKHKAILIKRDDKEHLVILGANSELVVESDIESQQDAEVLPLKKSVNQNDT